MKEEMEINMINKFIYNNEKKVVQQHYIEQEEGKKTSAT